MFGHILVLNFVPPSTSHFTPLSLGELSLLVRMKSPTNAVWEKTVKANENEISNYPNWLEKREWERALSYTFLSLSKPFEEIALTMMYSLAKAMRQPSPHCHFWLLFTALLQSLWVVGTAELPTPLPVFSSSRRWMVSFSQASCLHP